MKRNEIFSIVVIVLIVVVAVIWAPQDSMTRLFTAGGGVSLQDLNKEDSTSAALSVTLQFNQTTAQNLEQGFVSGNYFYRHKNIFVGGALKGGFSTQIGICCPTLYVSGGLDFKNFQIEGRIGDFKRTQVTAIGVDPQYSNFCLILGEGAAAKKTMQLSFIKGAACFSVGHQGSKDFYKLSDGCWYVYAQTPVCQGLFVSGGINFADETTGYAAVKVSGNNNNVIATANNVGADNQSFILTYNRENLTIARQKMLMSVSAWAQKSARGVHWVAGLNKGKGTFYAEAGINSTLLYKAYFGLGTSFTF